MIFLFSSQEARESENISRNGVTKFILSHYSGFDNFSEEKKIQIEDTIDFIVRKTAHATEYAIMALLSIYVIFSHNIFNRFYTRIMLAIIIVMLYAASDEFHQTFVKGRSGNIKDVCIDTLGGIIGCLIFCIVCTLFKKIRIRIRIK